MAESSAARPRESMSRALRTARGASGAFAATLLAAASHALAGGQVTLLALVATSVLALPLCVALAGRVASLWRLTVAVGVSQFVYHWSFAGLGTPPSGSTVADASLAAGPHAGHLAMLSFTPQLTAAAPSGMWMWGAHTIAAALTIALLHRGERSVQAMLRLLLRAVALPMPGAVAVTHTKQPAAPLSFERPLPDRLALLSPISHRGPPAGPAFAL